VLNRATDGNPGPDNRLRSVQNPDLCLDLPDGQSDRQLWLFKCNDNDAAQKVEATDYEFLRGPVEPASYL
jgi:hypothetical protein